MHRGAASIASGIPDRAIREYGTSRGEVVAQSSPQNRVPAADMKTACPRHDIESGGPLTPTSEILCAHVRFTEVLRPAFSEETLRAGGVHKWADDLTA